MGLFSKSADIPTNIPTFEADADVQATFHTSMGEFQCTLFAQQCPVTVGNFVGLATGEVAWTNPEGEPASGPLYSETVFHRIIKNFMIQGGDPRGNGTGGPGYQFKDEIVPELRHSKPGILSMANAGPNTNGSQFFITEVATPWLDGKHTVFGEVTKGIDTVLAICNAPTGPQDRPVNPIVLKKVEIEIK